MIKKIRKPTGKFVVFDDDDNPVTLIEHTPITTFQPGKLPTVPTIAGRPTYQLSTGEPVIRLSDTEFEVVGSRLKLHKRS